MNRFVTLIAAVLLAACSFGENANKADAEVRQFHAAINDSKFGPVIAASAPEMRGTPKFLQLLEVTKKKLGRVVSTKQVNWNENVGTGGHVVVLNYETQFEKGTATENFVYRKDGDRLVLAGWHINSDALILN